MLSTKQIVYQHPFFANLTESHRNILLGHAVPRTFEIGEFLFRQSEPANNFYLLGSGKVSLEAVTQDESITVQLVGEGEVLGLSWLYPPYEWQFNAKAIDTTNALVFDAQVLRAVCEKDHELGYQLMRRYGCSILERLKSTRQRLIDEHLSSTGQSTQHRNHELRK